MKGLNRFWGLLLLIFFSCVDNNYQMSFDFIKLIESNNLINLSEIVDSVDYLFLDFNSSEFVIGEIVGTKLIDNDLLIKQKVGNITMFQRINREGKYLNEIGDYGRGAGEIYNPRDIITINGEYIMWDYRGLHQITKDGQYIKFLFNAQIPGTRFFYSKNHYFFIHELTAPGFMSKYTDKGKLKKIYFPNEYSFGSLNYCAIEQVGLDSIHIASPLIDTIYSFSNSNLTPVYQIETGDNKSFQKVLLETENLSPLEQLKVINREKPNTIKLYLENNNYIFITYFINSKIDYLLINKKTDDKIYFSSCINDLDNGFWGSPMLLTDDNELFCVIYPHEITNKLPLGGIGHNYEKINSLKEEDNPFYVIYKLK